jgi:3-methyladenine DNA glycosylase AlkD
MSAEVIRELKRLRNPERARFSLRYFKTGKGQYGEGDRFLGLNTKQVRQLGKRFRDLDFPDLQLLLQSRYHEARVVALLILVEKFRKQPERRKKIFDFYLKNRAGINNWDLVDCSAPHIVGAYLYERDRKILHRLAHSPSLWDRRIAILSTLYFIKNSDLEETFRIAETLLADREDLMHKAIGWMLRETGKKDRVRLQSFLDAHYEKIPRTTLRYAIERFPEPVRKEYLGRPRRHGETEERYSGPDGNAT